MPNRVGALRWSHLEQYTVCNEPSLVSVPWPKEGKPAPDRQGWLAWVAGDSGSEDATVDGAAPEWA
jgi:hypothetical protein